MSLRSSLRFLALCSVGVTASMAQQYEFGGLGGLGFLNGSTVTAPAGTATAGFKPGFAAGILLGHRMYPLLSGEVRYIFRKQDLRLTSGGQEPTFGAQSHIVHYDVLLHTRSGDSHVQPFAAVGGGMKIYRGTGVEAAYQPLGNFAYLTKTQDVRPLISAGGGVKVRVAPRILLRVEFRDYITPFPVKVITPASGAKIKGWVHDIVPMAGISFEF